MMSKGTTTRAVFLYTLLMSTQLSYTMSEDTIQQSCTVVFNEICKSINHQCENSTYDRFQLKCTPTMSVVCANDNGDAEATISELGIIVGLVAVTTYLVYRCLPKRVRKLCRPL